MKFYIAAPFKRRDEVRDLNRMLRSRGHTIPVDWTYHASIFPYDENFHIARQYAIEDLDGVVNSDVFILLPDGENSVGHKIEFGTAVASHLIKGKPLVYVVGDFTNSMFNYHPCVQHRKSIDDIVKELEIKI